MMSDEVQTLGVEIEILRQRCAGLESLVVDLLAFSHGESPHDLALQLAHPPRSARSPRMYPLRVVDKRYRDRMLTAARARFQ